MVIYVLLSVIILQEIFHHFERRDLYDRIMSKNLTEYKGEKSVKVSAHERVLTKWRKKGGEIKK
jgi:hypothetical protein